MTLGACRIFVIECLSYNSSRDEASGDLNTEYKAVEFVTDVSFFYSSDFHLPRETDL